MNKGFYIRIYAIKRHLNKARILNILMFIDGSKNNIGTIANRNIKIKSGYKIKTADPIIIPMFWISIFLVLWSCSICELFSLKYWKKLTTINKRIEMKIWINKLAVSAKSLNWVPLVNLSLRTSAVKESLKKEIAKKYFMVKKRQDIIPKKKIIFLFGSTSL